MAFAAATSTWPRRKKPGSPKPRTNSKPLYGLNEDRMVFTHDSLIADPAGGSDLPGAFPHPANCEPEPAEPSRHRKQGPSRFRPGLWPKVRRGMLCQKLSTPSRSARNSGEAASDDTRRAWLLVGSILALGGLPLLDPAAAHAAVTREEVEHAIHDGVQFSSSSSAPTAPGPMPTARRTPAPPAW